MHHCFLCVDYLCTHRLSTRPLLPSTRPQKWWCKMRWTMQLRVGQLSSLRTDCPLFRMPIGCELCNSLILYDLNQQYMFRRYFIKDGTVCEFGTHDELLQKRGKYYKYVQLQGLKSRK